MHHSKSSISLNLDNTLPHISVTGMQLLDSNMILILNCYLLTFPTHTFEQGETNPKNPNKKHIIKKIKSNFKTTMQRVQ